MTDSLAYLVRALIALGILLAAARVLLLRKRTRSRRLPRKSQPTGQGRPHLARLLAASVSSAYSRDRVQERLRLVAEDLASLNHGHAATAEGHEEQLLADYFAEDHVGFRGGAHHRPSRDPGFLRHTEAVLELLEKPRHDSKGEHP